MIKLFKIIIIFEQVLAVLAFYYTVFLSDKL